jgi:universal stress protein E
MGGIEPGHPEEPSAVDTIRRILVVVDPTIEQSAAVQKAAAIARAAAARIDLYLCDFSPELDAARFYDTASLAVAVEPVAARHSLHLDRLAAPLRAAGLEVHTEVEFRNPLHEGIVRKIARARPDLVVKDTHYHGVLRRTLFANNDWHLIRECQVPLLLTRQAAWHAPVRITAAVDPNHPADPKALLDHAILDHAVAFAGLLGAQAGALHVFSTLNLMAVDPGLAAVPGAPLPVDPATVTALRGLHRAQLEGLAQRHGIPPREAWLVEGIVTYALPEFVAEHELDVLALGAVARSALRERFIGSTAERVLDRLPCDLLVVHHGATAAG